VAPRFPDRKARQTRQHSPQTLPAFAAGRLEPMA